MHAIHIVLLNITNLSSYEQGMPSHIQYIYVELVELVQRVSLQCYSDAEQILYDIYYGIDVNEHRVERKFSGWKRKFVWKRSLNLYKSI